MFNQIQLLKAIAATGCPRPLTHYKILRQTNRITPSWVLGGYVNDICCCQACEERTNRWEERESTKLAVTK